MQRGSISRTDLLHLCVGALGFVAMMAVAIVSHGFREETQASLRRIESLQSKNAPVRFTIEYTKVKGGTPHKILVHVREGDAENAWIEELEQVAKDLEAFHE